LLADGPAAFERPVLTNFAPSSISPNDVIIP
jgi:hypothetical protein